MVKNMYGPASMILENRHLCNAKVKRMQMQDGATAPASYDTVDMLWIAED